MIRRDFIKCLAHGMMASSLLASPDSIHAKTTKPNIIFFFADDQRFDTLNACNNPEIITPNMDSFVKNGTSFARAHIFGASSAAVCAPSRAMLMTGRTFFELPRSVWAPWKVPDEESGICPYITFPEVFRNAGYTTFGTGKQHNGTRIFYRGFTAGAKLFFNGMHSPKKGGHLTPNNISDFDPTGVYNKEYTEKKFSTELFSDAAVAFVRKYNSSRPLMMYISYTAPHDPRMAPDKFKKMYPWENISLPKNFLPGHPFDNGKLKIRDEKLAPFPRTPERVKQEIAGYYAMITHLDHHIGRVMAAIRKKGLDKNTIFIFAGDNGLAVGQHGLMGKQNLYEHSLGVPLILSGPGIAKNKKIMALCYLHDLFPTLCDLTGLNIPKSVTSRSLLPLLHDNNK